MPDRPLPSASTLALAVRLLGVILVVSAEGYVIGVVGENFAPAHHFSFFTVLSNLIGAAVFAAAILRPVPDVIRGAATTCLVTTGIVYAALLRGTDVQTPGYANLILHLVMPILVALDWLLFPPSSRVPLRHAALWLVFPAAYLTYTLLRGPWVDWYPYPFLDPRLSGDYLHVTVTCLVVAAIIAMIAATVWAVGNWRAPQEARHNDPTVVR